MDIVFATENPFLPQVFGGTEVNTHQLAQELTKRGHRVVVLAKLSRADLFGLWREARAAVTRKRVHVDEDLGYRVVRARRPREIVEELPRFDVAVLMNAGMLEMAQRFSQAGVPSVGYLNGVTELLGWKQEDVRGANASFKGFIAVSEFAARRFHDVHGAEAVVLPPIFRADDYVTQVVGHQVTFINPVPLKGVRLALNIAERCPDIPFCFVRGWRMGVKALAGLKARIRGLPNVTLRSSTYDVRSILRDTRILLVPTSLGWEETWGRVVSEAQLSGIPVVASNHGALPEAVGPGGILLGFTEAPEVWAGAIRALWTDPALYRDMSDAARQHSQRPQLDPDRQIDKLLATLQSFARRSGPGSS